VRQPEIFAEKIIPAVRRSGPMSSATSDGPTTWG
jgi:hypothetical protein